MASTFIQTLLSNSGSRSASQHASVFSAGSQAAGVNEQNRRLVLDHGEEAVVNDVQSLLQQGSPQTSKVLKVILLATRTSALSASIAPSDATACSSLRSTLFSCLPKWVHSIPQEEHSMASDLASAFLPELDQQQPSNITTLMYACLSALEDAKPHSITMLELVPPCLAAVSTAPADDIMADVPAAAAAEDGDDDGASAAAGAAGHAVLYRDAVVSRMLACEWKQEDTAQVLQVVKALPLSTQQLEKCIKKAVISCRKVSLQQLPPILYQVLLLSSCGARQFALTGLKRLFAHLEQQPANQAPSNPAAATSAAAGTGGSMPCATLLQVEATLLMHISTLLKYDAALGSEWLKWFRSHGVEGDSSFILQVLLTMSRHHKLEQPVQQLLKKAVQQACADEALQVSGSSSRWMATLPAVGKGPSLATLQQGLLRAVRCSCYASELVCPGLLQLASSLITTPGSSPMHIVIAARGGKRGSLPHQASASARAVWLGLLLLQEIFEVHAEARTEVLKVAQGQLSCSNLDAALPHVLLLSSICRDQPALLSSYVPQLKDCLCSFAGLSADAALVLLLALWPLCRVRSDLQDHVIMLLRKMMYRQDVSGRLVAIRGFLCLILQHLADAPQTPAAIVSGSEASCSQASLSQVSSLSGGRGINLLQELAAVLRRALGQQAPVREALYDGLLQVLAADPGSHELLCELLLPHLLSFIPEGSELPPLLLHRCAEVVQGEAVLLEPLPALLRCVHRLAAAEPAQASSQWAGPSHQQCSSALQACFAKLRSKLSSCQLEHFDLGQAGDLNPLQPDGLLGQLHASNLLGVLQVVMEDVVGDIQRFKEEQPDATTRDPSRVAELGEELAKLFDLHNQIASLALEGSRGPSKAGAKKGSKKGASTGTAPDAGEQQGTAGQKRSKPSSSFTPVTRQPANLSASCLATLCMAIVDDGLLPLPSNYDITLPNWHMQLARDHAFRSFVLRSCSNLLEGAQSAAAATAMLQLESPSGPASAAAAASGDGSRSGAGAPVAPAADEVLVLGPALFQVIKLVMYTAGLGNNTSDSSAAGSGEGHESLEQLSANALLQLLKLADATQQLAALFKVIPLEDGSFPPEDQQVPAAGGANDGADVDAAAQPRADQASISPENAGAVTAAATAAAVLPRLPQLEACIDKLMQRSFFKEAQTCIECLLLLGRQLGSPSLHQAAMAGSSDAGQQQRQQKQVQVPSNAELSRWAVETALQQEQPEVKLVGLAKALLDLYIRFHASDDVAALKTTVLEIQSLVGDCETDTQATPRHPRRLRMLLADKTAQPCAAAALTYMDEGIGQLERLVGGNLKAGLVQEGDSAEQARDRRRLSGAVCKRLQGLLECLAVLVNTIFGMPPIIDHQVRVLTRAYKLLGMLAKAHQLPKSATNKQLPPEFESLVSMVNRDLTHRVYHFIIDDQEAQQAEPGKVKLARVKREAKQVPQLVFNMEAWEKQLVTTGKAAGGKNLLKDAKRASIRDFKIKAQEEGDAQYAVEAGAAAAAAGGTAAGRGRGRGRGGTRGGRGAGRGGGSSGRSVRSGSGSVGNSAGRAPSGAASGSGQRGQEDSVATEQGVEEEEGMEVDGARVREDDE